MENLLAFKGHVFNGDLDLDDSVLLSIPSKPHYAAVNLSFKCKGFNASVLTVSNDDLDFYNKQKFGKELEKRWNEYHELRELNKELQGEIERLKALVPPVETGKNRYGLDVGYFRRAINRDLNRGLENYQPDELARVFPRLSVTADKSVMREAEFEGREIPLGDAVLVNVKNKGVSHA